MTDLADGMTRIAEPGDRAGRDIYVGRLRLPQIGSSAPSHLRQRHVEKYGALSRLEPVHLEPRSHRGMRTGEMKHQGCIAQSRPDDVDRHQGLMKKSRTDLRWLVKSIAKRCRRLDR